ncbi:hypothetical protein CLF_108985 [Clonorchis sinensis]|uniref:Uncharacterized protein n=1 Tax=Clonorchis sinensis TaxID=79923 RepID=G7YS50_CLOSI|nr:hypothetical protein CLF_108985 [Clonorchis sinensis]
MNGADINMQTPCGSSNRAQQPVAGSVVEIFYNFPNSWIFPPLQPFVPTRLLRTELLSRPVPKLFDIAEVVLMEQNCATTRRSPLRSQAKLSGQQPTRSSKLGIAEVQSAQSSITLGSLFLARWRARVKDSAAVIRYCEDWWQLDGLDDDAWGYFNVPKTTSNSWRTDVTATTGARRTGYHSYGWASNNVNKEILRVEKQEDWDTAGLSKPPEDRYRISNLTVGLNSHCGAHLKVARYLVCEVRPAEINSARRFGVDIRRTDDGERILQLYAEHRLFLASNEFEHKDSH